MFARSLRQLSRPVARQLRGPMQWRSLSSSQSADSPILFETRDHVQWITLNRPTKYNALTFEMYSQIINQLKVAAENPEVRFLTITGKGDYYSSGNDLNNLPKSLMEHDGDVDKATQAGVGLVKELINALIDFPKPVIGVVNGPAFGIMVTILALMDQVIASDTATFTTPFTSLGQAPEGCSTFTFPRILGQSLASKMLLFNYRMPAIEAHQRGFVSEVVPKEKLQAHVENLLYGEKGLVKTCYPNSMINAKALIRDEATRKMLHEVNDREIETLSQAFKSEECADALGKFFTRK